MKNIKIKRNLFIYLHTLEYKQSIGHSSYLLTIIMKDIFCPNKGDQEKEKKKKNKTQNKTKTKCNNFLLGTWPKN